MTRLNCLSLHCFRNFIILGELLTLPSLSSPFFPIYIVLTLIFFFLNPENPSSDTQKVIVTVTNFQI